MCTRTFGPFFRSVMVGVVTVWVVVALWSALSLAKSAIDQRKHSDDLGATSNDIYRNGPASSFGDRIAKLLPDNATVLLVDMSEQDANVMSLHLYPRLVLINRVESVGTNVGSGAYIAYFRNSNNVTGVSEEEVRQQLATAGTTVAESYQFFIDDGIVGVLLDVTG